jgi:hypothetical protein
MVGTRRQSTWTESLAEVPATGACQRSPRSVGKGVRTPVVNGLSVANCAVRRASGGRGQLDICEKSRFLFRARLHPHLSERRVPVKNVPAMWVYAKAKCGLIRKGRSLVALLWSTPDAAASPHALQWGLGGICVIRSATEI